MKKVKINLGKDRKYVIACSFGPDSMALLHAAYESSYDIVVAHVNYHKRDVSNYEQASLEKYCAKRKIPCEVLDTNGLKSEGNFQEWARELRYKFFAEVVKKYNADSVLVAHQQDDLIETYLMQKKRGNFVKNYGIAEENEIFGVKVLRPLLGYTKKELLDFDISSEVPFSIDESNLTNHYERNKIRHNTVEKMSPADREKIISEIRKHEKHFPLDKKVFTLDEFRQVSYEDFVLMIDERMNKLNEHRDVSKGYFNEIKKAALSKSNVQFKLSKDLLMEKDYNSVRFINLEKLSSYSFEFEKVFKNEFIEIDFSKGAQDRGIKENHLIVKNCGKNDLYKINGYFTKVRRLFIDWKLPKYLREVWPGIYDKNGNLIYVPRYRETLSDKHTSKFKIDTDYFLTF